ncbi:hypothetical protein TWF730_005920 [Orbilia blumenaviensis]|uniref:Uncharacterized protein n=1 Tax=Orbilia blumenaviensis TaxID=1796055 RepID=A0AAV9VK10_9PEZI
MVFENVNKFYQNIMEVIRFVLEMMINYFIRALSFPSKEPQAATVKPDGKYQIEIGEEENVQVIEVDEENVKEFQLAAPQNRSLFNRIGR